MKFEKFGSATSIFFFFFGVCLWFRFSLLT